MIVRHVALENEWNTNENLQNAQKLILGSFNPYNINGDNTDYFYGRCTNYFWKALAELNNLNPNIFFNNLDLKLEYMHRYRFCFMDVIDSIVIECQGNNELIINKVTQIIESYGLTCKVEMPKQHIELVGISEKL